MIQLRKHLQKVRKFKRHQYHPIIHKIHKKHNISKRTLFYMKEYGPHSNVPKTIIKESIKILLLASIISSLGGLALENIKASFSIIVPIVILLPILNDMIGDYGTIISSKFSTLLHEGHVKSGVFKSGELRDMFFRIIIIAFITAVFSAIFAMTVSGISSFVVSGTIAIKIMTIAVVDTLLLVGILFFVAIVAGIHFFKKQEDPSNFLIPITTSIADLGNMVILALLVITFF
jgi:cation transporter-like permease